MKYRTIFPAFMLCLGTLNGCGAARPSKFYQLTVPGDRTSGAAPAPYPVTLVLGPITSSDLYRDDQIVYTSDGQAMGQYQYHRWAEPPPEMIHDVLLRELQVSGRYQQVYSLRSDVRGDYLLCGRLYDFREIDGSPLVARVAFEFELRSYETGTVVWKRYYSHDEPVNGKDVADVVAAMNRDVLSGLSEIRGGLEHYISAQAAAVGVTWSSDMLVFRLVSVCI
jgi:ABC-type uncharacterized transport system auxiliary subunit